MLPPEHRLRRSADFTAVLRTGRRTARPTIVVHLMAARPADRVAAGARGPATDEPARAPRLGLIVSRAVGNSVVRHRVSRRLRAVAAAELAGLPAGVDVVVRARPAAATADSVRLAADLGQALHRLSGHR